MQKQMMVITFVILAAMVAMVGIVGMVIFALSNNTAVQPVAIEVTATQEPTEELPTLKPLVTLEVIEATQEPTPTKILETVTRFFNIQDGTPVMHSSAIHESCNWFGVGGNVYNSEDEPEVDLIIHVQTLLTDQYAITGSAVAYGMAGYEIAFSDMVNYFVIEVLELNGNPISVLSTINPEYSCENNLILINYVAE